MNRIVMSCVGVAALAVAGCSPAEGPGTTTGAGGANSAGTGGSTGGSSSAGTGGTGAGGSSNPGTGGSGAGGSSNPGTGGTGAGGSSNPGTGGSGAGGNRDAGTTGMGGSSGAGGSAAGGAGGTGGIDINTLVPGLDGYYWEGTCSGNVTATGRNCPFYAANVTTCAAGTNWDTRGTIKSKMLTVGGTPGQRYTINFEVRGIVGTRCYTGGTIASTAVPNANGANNAWYVGGKQFNDSIWNTYEIHVTGATGDPTVYYANAFGTDTVNTSWCQKEATYQIGYTAKFSVVGGSTITFTIHDTNCQAQQNCGADDTSTVCNMMKTVDLSGLSPQPPTSFRQPPTNQVGNMTYYPQWLYFDVKSVTSP